MERKRAFRVVILAAIAGLPMTAQTTSGSIKGTVTDPSGAAVPGVEVQARNEGTSITTRVVTNAEGGFTLLTLPAGAYDVVADAAGFKKTVETGVVVDVGVTTRVDLRLEVGSASERIEVAGTAPVITPDTSEAGTVLTSTEYENLHF